MTVLRALVVGVVLSGSVVGAQVRRPSFLDEAPTRGRLETRHLQAAIDGPVRVAADGRALVTVLVTPLPGMHVYAADVDGGYVPFTLATTALTGLRAGTPAYPKAEMYVFPPTGESSRVYMAPFRASLPLTLSAELRRKVAAGVVAGGTLTLRYQACDDTVCYRPTTGTLAFDFES